MNRLNILCLLLIVSINAEDFDVNPLNEFYKTQLGKDLTFYTESGYVTIEGGAKDSVNRYFYHLFLKDGVDDISKVKADDTFALWLNGGPGCSSQFGNFGEIGPFQVVKDKDNKLTVEQRPTSWNKFAHLIFVDQPFNVGLSHSTDKTIISTTGQAAEYFAKFLKKFFEKHTIFQQTKFHIFGESFAGHYIPAIGEEIYKQKLDTLIKLTGVAIGDGWTSPFHQMSYYGSFLYSIGVVDNLRRDTARQVITEGQAAILNGDFLTATEKFDYASDNLINEFGGGVSAYNFQEYPGKDSNNDLADFINANKLAYKVPDNVKFTECNDEIYNLFKADITTNREESLLVLLNKGVKVLLFNGQLDFIVNTPAALTWINQLKWNKITQWKAQPKQIFKAVNPATNVVEPVGSVKHFENLYFAVVYRAGHMVPTDNPNAALAMINHFLNEDDWTV